VLRGKATVVRALSTGLGLGLLPVAPGTWASAGAALAYVGFRSLADPWDVAALPIALGVCTLLGLAVCPFAEIIYARKDPQPFVLDEIAGLWLTCLLFPWGTPWQTAIAAFVAFRIFDIAKPPPIRRIERLPSGFGVMLDDLAAGLYSAGVLWLLRYVILDRLFG
jgi:phosphatidylglycerophosphatase A